jgi:hypothetical protein
MLVGEIKRVVWRRRPDLNRKWRFADPNTVLNEPAMGTVARPPRDGELQSGMYRPKVIEGPERHLAW